jgi:hypothetical protein
MYQHVSTYSKYPHTLCLTTPPLLCPLLLLSTQLPPPHTHTGPIVPKKKPKGKTLHEIEQEEGGPVKESMVGMAAVQRALRRKKREAGESTNMHGGKGKGGHGCCVLTGNIAAQRCSEHCAGRKGRQVRAHTRCDRGGKVVEGV